MCPQAVMKEFPDIRVAFGESDEYSFVFHKDAVLYGRRASKIISLITSCFSVNYVRMWSSFFPDTPLEKNPLFDGRVVLYPNLESLRDYLSWRQADTHINCQYNTCYWMLIKEGKSREEVQKMLRGTLTADKNEIMFQRGVNYNTLPAMFRKVLYLLKVFCSIDVTIIMPQNDLCVCRGVWWCGLSWLLSSIERVARLFKNQ